MNANKKKIEKLNLEYTKNDKKIAALMERQQEIEKQRTALENLEIIGMVRGLGMSFNELTELINGEKTAAELSTAVAAAYTEAVADYHNGGILNG